MGQKVRHALPAITGQGLRSLSLTRITQGSFFEVWSDTWHCRTSFAYARTWLREQPLGFLHDPSGEVAGRHGRKKLRYLPSAGVLPLSIRRVVRRKTCRCNSQRLLSLQSKRQSVALQTICARSFPSRRRLCPWSLLLCVSLSYL